MKRLATFAAVAVSILAGCTPADPEKQNKRDAIALCWEQQGKKSLDPGTARFVAGACERMEDDFKAKYGHKP